MVAAARPGVREATAVRDFLTSLRLVDGGWRLRVLRREDMLHRGSTASSMVEWIHRRRFQRAHVASSPFDISLTHKRSTTYFIGELEWNMGSFRG